MKGRTGAETLPNGIEPSVLRKTTVMAERTHPAYGRPELYPSDESYWHKFERDPDLEFRKPEKRGTKVTPCQDKCGGNLRHEQGRRAAGPHS